MDLRHSDLVRDEECKHQKERRCIEERLNDSEQRAGNWREKVENIIDFAAYTHEWFATGDFQSKRSAVFALGSNFNLKDGIISHDKEKVWEIFSDAAPKLRKDIESLGLDENGSINEKNTAFVSVISSWQNTPVWSSPV